MKKGFLFTVEAIICIILVVSVIAIAALPQKQNDSQSNYAIIKQQAKQATTFYFNENASQAQNPNSQICGVIAYYSGAINQKQICGDAK